MGRMILYIVGAIALVLIAGVGYVAYLTQKSAVSDNTEETTFDETGPLVNGFAIVTKNYPRDLWGNGQDRYGFVDAAGKRITFVKYRLVEPFSEGRAYVRNSKDGCGFIDTRGREVIPLIYANAGRFVGGVTIAEKSDGEQLQTGFIDRDGRELGPFRYNRYNTAGDDYYAVGVGKLNEEKWGFTDLQGHELIAPQFDEPGLFRNGYASVGKIDPANGQMMHGCIDSTGRIIVPFEYSGVGGYEPKTGLIEVVKYYDKDGRLHLQKGKVNLRNELVEPLTDEEEK